MRIVSLGFSCALARITVLPFGVNRRVCVTVMPMMVVGVEPARGSGCRSKDYKDPNQHNLRMPPKRAR